MLKPLVLAATVAASLTVSTPVAHAAVVRSGCGIDSLAQETLTGGQDTFTGAAYGYAAFDDQGTHTLRCYVTVDGVEQATTPAQSGTAFVSTAGQVTYHAADGATVDLCTEIDGQPVACAAVDEQSIPPQEVVDAIDLLLVLLDCASDCPPYWLLGPTLCSLFQVISPGIPGVLAITGEDAVSDIAGWSYDCPPFGNL